jgi:hypothetical protein
MTDKGLMTRRIVKKWAAHFAKFNPAEKYNLSAITSNLTFMSVL